MIQRIIKILSRWRSKKTNPIQTQTNPILSAVGGLQMNVNSLITKDYRKKDDFAIQKNKPNSNPISATPKKNVTLFTTKDYENETAFRLRKNKPKQSQFVFCPPPSVLCFLPLVVLCSRMKPKLLNFHRKNSLTVWLNSLKYLFLCCERDFSMKSFMAKKEQVEQKWLLVDADGVILGRMAAKIAPILMGKNKPTYTPHVDTGDYVIVVNAEKIQLTGKKAQTKEYDYYTHFPGGHKFVSFADMMAKKPEKVIELAIRRMLPKNKLGRKMLKKLKVYRGPEHDNQAQKPEKIELS